MLGELLLLKGAEGRTAMFAIVNLRKATMNTLALLKRATSIEPAHHGTLDLSGKNER